MKQPCHMCNSAFVDDELTSSNDLSYYSIGKSYDNHRMLIRSGAGKPVTVLVEQYDEKSASWILVGYYKPNYCPNCGRELVENKNI